MKKNLSKKLIVLLVGLSIVALVFQNCSNRMTTFQQTSEATNEMQQTETSTPVVETVSETKEYSKNISAFQPVSQQLDIHLLIDDSKSNANNANNIVQGIKNLFDRLTNTNQFSISVRAFSMGYRGDWAKSTNVIKSGAGRIDPINSTTYNRISEYPRGNPIVGFNISSSQSQADVENALLSGLNTIQTHLNNAMNADGSQDTTPFPFCDIVALLSDNKSASAKRSTVFILITDEDSERNITNQECIKRWDVTYRYGGNGVPYVMVSATKNVAAEGGGTTPSGETVSITSISSCAQTGDITNYLVSRGYNSTYSNCYVYPNSSGGDTQTGENYYFSWLDEKYSSAESIKHLKINPHLQRTFELPMQGPVFIGLFSIQNANDLKNPDQEISANLSNWIPTILPAGQFQLQSLTNPNYASFIDQVMNFKMNVDNNTVSIADLIAQIPSGKSLIITEVHFNGVKIQSFSRQGSSIIVNDSSVKIADGGDLKIIYGFQ